jgi:hypothetical protein
MLESQHRMLVRPALIVMALSAIMSCAEPKTQIVHEDPFAVYELPVLPGSFEINKTVHEPPGTKAVFYLLNIDYPAKEVLLYYDGELGKQGFIPYMENGWGNREWGHFIDGTKPGTPHVDQLLASWIDPSKTVRVILGLSYVYREHNQRKDTLEVICQIQPFFDLGKNKEEPFKK